MLDALHGHAFVRLSRPLAFALVIAGAPACADGSSVDAPVPGPQGTAETGTTTAGAAGSFVCQVDTMGGPEMCLGDAAWQDRAEAICALQGQALRRLETRGSCADNRSSHARFTCCASATPAGSIDDVPTLDPPVTAGGPATCISGNVPAIDACRLVDAWAQSSMKHCAAQGQALAGYDVRTECAPGRYAAVDFHCCPVADSCLTLGLDAENTCQSAAQWLAQAEAACGNHGLDVSEFQADGHCKGAGKSASFTGAVFTCCPPPGEAAE